MIVDKMQNKKLMLNKHVIKMNKGYWPNSVFRWTQMRGKEDEVNLEDGDDIGERNMAR